MMSIRMVALSIAALGWYWLPATVQAGDHKPLWEIGIAAGYLHVPEYMGSDEDYSLALGVPYLIYRGDFFRADREGLRGIFFDSERLSLDLGFSFGLPVDNDNRARRGMPDLHLTAQIGPRLNWIVYNERDRPKATFRLPARYTFDTHGEGLGWVVEPSIRVEREHLGQSGRWNARADFGLLYAGRRNNEYYYGVPTAYATPERPAYSADSGLHSVFMHLSADYRVDKRLTVGAFARFHSLSDGVIDDSPLVKDDDYVFLGVGLRWSFWQSKAAAP